MATNSETQASQHQQPEAHPPRPGCRFEPGQILHITSRLHEQKARLQWEEAKSILRELIVQYGRVCRVCVLHYAILDNHLHLVVRVLPDSEPISRFVGCIKAGFTRAFKRWYNQLCIGSGPPLERSTMWDGPYHASIVGEGRHRHNVVCYVSTNRSCARDRQQIMALQEPPQLGRLSREYRALLERMAQDRQQSTAVYLSGMQQLQHREPVLTDGTDAVWATEEEVRLWWKRKVSELPDGWRKISFGGQRRILKDTPPELRSLGQGPWWTALGDDDEARAEAMAYSLCDYLWHKRLKWLREQAAQQQHEQMLRRGVLLGELELEVMDLRLGGGMLGGGDDRRRSRNVTRVRRKKNKKNRRHRKTRWK